NHHFSSNGNSERPPVGPIRLLLVDEQKLYREGLTTVFSRHNDIRVVGQARTGLEACDKARRARPDVILMDTRIPDMDGVAATRSEEHTSELQSLRHLVCR